MLGILIPKLIVLFFRFPIPLSDNISPYFHFGNFQQKLIEKYKSFHILVFLFFGKRLGRMSKVWTFKDTARMEPNDTLGICNYPEAGNKCALKLVKLICPEPSKS